MSGISSWVILTSLQKPFKHPYNQVIFPTNCRITSQHNCLIGYDQASHMAALHSCNTSGKETATRDKRLYMNN